MAYDFFYVPTSHGLKIRKMSVETAKQLNLAKVDAKQVEKHMKSPRTLAGKVLSYLSAHRDMRQHGPASKPVQEHRLTVCSGINPDGDRVDTMCRYFTPRSPGERDGHCKACGCPAHKKTLMSVKVRYKKTTCPLNRFTGVA